MPPPKIANWRIIEYGMKFGISWNHQLAEQFNKYYASIVNVRPKIIKYNISGNNKTYIGLHTQFDIRISPRLSDEQKWQVLIHEISHYRISKHKDNFCEEMQHCRIVFLDFAEKYKLLLK